MSKTFLCPLKSVLITTRLSHINDLTSFLSLSCALLTFLFFPTSLSSLQKRHSIHAHPCHFTSWTSWHLSVVKCDNELKRRYQIVSRKKNCNLIAKNVSSYHFSWWCRRKISYLRQAKENNLKGRNLINSRSFLSSRTFFH